MTDTGDPIRDDILEMLSPPHDKGNGFVYFHALVGGAMGDGSAFPMEWAETPEGNWIGNKEDAEYLESRGIAHPEPRDRKYRVCSIGFNEAEQKWYGWSHRAIYGFGIGSTVKRGDGGYVADTPEGLIDEYVAFHERENARDECQILPDRSGIRVLRRPLLIPVADSFEHAIEVMADENATAELPIHDINEGYYEVKCGRGEWTAKTLEDAKQMARDFAEAVG